MKKNETMETVKYFVFLFGLFAAVSPAFAKDNAGIIKKANKLYESKNYEEALELYNEAFASGEDLPEINYGMGAVNYKKPDFKKAHDCFEKSLVSKDKKLESKANYNIANTKYRLGKSEGDKNPESAVKTLSQSLEYYKRAVELDEKDNDAKFNYEFVKKELKLLEEKAKQEKQKQQQEQSQEARQQEKQQEEEKQQQESQPQEPIQEEKEQPAKQQQAQQEAEPKEMSKEEARILLEGYMQEENALGEIKDKRKAQPGHVLKDW